MRIVLSVSLMLCLSCLGCSAPGWIDHPPASRRYIYAVGRWPKSYYANQRQRAAEEARGEIGRTLHSRINELILLVQTSYNTTTIERLRRVTSSVTATDLEGCEVVKYWKDEDGDAGPKETMYALARISRQDAQKAIQKVAGNELQDEEQQALERILQKLKGDTGGPD